MQPQNGWESDAKLQEWHATALPFWISTAAIFKVNKKQTGARPPVRIEKNIGPEIYTKKGIGSAPPKSLVYRTQGR